MNEISLNKPLNFLLAGVGGQGIILASDVLVNVGVAAGYAAKQAEIHGMSQRGGSVTSYVRWGKEVYSPLVGAGEVDVLLAFEKLEALRNLNQLRTGALALINQREIRPLTVISGSMSYPSEEAIRAAFEQITPHTRFFDAETIAMQLGDARVENVVLLGALSVLLEMEGLIDQGLTVDTWQRVIAERVPAKARDLNLVAFEAGRQAVTG
jgi:indolepyruvate ferredoxin oxidoreductase beta subunit